MPNAASAAQSQERTWSGRMEPMPTRSRRACRALSAAAMPVLAQAPHCTELAATPCICHCHMGRGNLDTA